MGRKPDFVIVGAMRSGTSSLAGYLDEHPEIHVTPRKEVHYFNRFYDRGMEWYLEQFSDSDGARIVGEATPNYMYVSLAMERMGQDLPDAKLIAILREPVARAYSHYWFNRSRGNEPLSFEDALEAESERLGQGDPLTTARASYFDRGLYADQLVQIAELFPRRQIHVLLFEDLVARPRRTFSNVCQFLDVDTAFTPENLGRQVNVYTEVRWPALNRYLRALPRSFGSILHRANRKTAAPYPPLDAALAVRLTERYEEPNQRLETWLGRDLAAWRRP